jgi:hypothetical protein
MRLRRSQMAPAQALRLDGGRISLLCACAGQRCGLLVQDGRATLVLENLPEGTEPLRSGNLHHLHARGEHTQLMGLYVSQGPSSPDEAEGLSPSRISGPP